MSELPKNLKPGLSKKELWEQHIESWRSSGLTQVQYCREHQLKIPTFQYWKSKFERRNLSRPLLPVAIQSNSPPMASSSVSSGIAITVNDQLRIELDVGFNRDTLLKTLDLIQGR